MKRLLLVALVAAAACKGPSITDIAQCQHDLGSAEGQLGAAKTAQAAAEAKLAGLEDTLQRTREELAIARKAGEDAARTLGGTDDAELAAKTAAAPAKTAAKTAAEEKPKADAPALKIGLSLPTQREERWVKDKLTMIAEARRRGLDLHVKVSDVDAAQQLAQCESLIAEGVKVLILAPMDSTGAGVIIEKANKAGVKVISYDRLVTDSPRDYYYLSFDNVKVGEMQAEVLARQVPRGTYLLLSGAPTDHNATLFREGAMKVLKPLIDKGDVKVAFDQPVKDWLPTEAQRLCEQAVSQNPKIDAVLAPNDGTAGGCLQALSAHGLKVPISGQDAELAAAIRIRNGLQTMTVFKDTRQLGKKAIEMAGELARGKAIATGGRTISNGKRQIPVVLLTPYAVTKDNMDELLVKSGYLPREAVYKD